MDYAEWVRRCAQRYREIVQLDEAEARSIAAECAEAECQRTGGHDVGLWLEPAEAANEDMNQWHHAVGGPWRYADQAAPSESAGYFVSGELMHAALSELMQH